MKKHNVSISISMEDKAFMDWLRLFDGQRDGEIPSMSKVFRRVIHMAQQTIEKELGKKPWESKDK